MSEMILCPARSKIEEIATLFRDFSDTAGCKTQDPHWRNRHGGGSAAQAVCRIN